MEFLVILGALSVVVMLGLATYAFLQHRRAGTVRALIRPRTAGGNQPGGAPTRREGVEE